MSVVRTGERGQASVELVAALPLLVATGLATLHLLAAGAAATLADHAAGAGALALARGGEPVAAARAAVPGWARSRVRVEVRGRRVRVTLRPPALGGEGVARRLAATAVADAGPRP